MRPATSGNVSLVLSVWLSPFAGSFAAFASGCRAAIGGEATGGFGSGPFPQPRLARSTHRQAAQSLDIRCIRRYQSATPMPRRRSGIRTITRSFLEKGVQTETMGWAVSQDAIAEVRASVDRFVRKQ